MFPCPCFLHQLTSIMGPEDGSKEKVTCPKYFIIPSVDASSTDTASIMDRAFTACGEVKGKHLYDEEWEVPFRKGRELVLGNNPFIDTAFLALLGCKHGAGPARMLTQHKAWFGQKKISKIKIWTTGLSEYNLMFEIADVD